ncbi:uncharacterized protein LOC113287160 [Papaver somniferum]|uniref:uncharacterized protein LOC113287160 n=1 Tax=Papaver somniferum TaxID=3469 RepID=UPI000E700302|nr:uncharacterized protein LOC113287160 [Papaver somniferum]
MQSWLCIKCLRIHAWKKSRQDSSHSHEVITGPLNDHGVEFLILDTVKPQTPPLVESIDGINGTVAATLSLETLDLIFQRQITTTVSIPPPCRLNFSRTLKATLENVLDKPMDLSAWLSLPLLLVCTLNMYIPKSVAEERSGSLPRRRRKMLTWRRAGKS